MRSHQKRIELPNHRKSERHKRQTLPAAKGERLIFMQITMTRFGGKTLTANQNVDSSLAWIPGNTEHRLVVDSMIRFRDPVRVIQFAKRSRSRIVRQFVRSVEFPVALTPLSLTDSAEDRAMASIP